MQKKLFNVFFVLLLLLLFFKFLCLFIFHTTSVTSRGEATLHMKGVGMLVGNFELNPERRLIWAWPKLFFDP